MYFIITIDTEGDNQWEEKCRRNITTENAKCLPRFQNLCEEYGFRPTYLVNYEMAVDEFFGKFGKECLARGTCEIGSHPHAWNSPPDYDLTGNDRKHMPYLIEYPEEIIYGKVKFLTDLLESTFETKIVSHRAGRWGFNEVYARILEQLDHKVDCSVTPFACWRSCLGAPDGKGGPDFSKFPTEAYFLNMNDISKAGCSSVLELPVTIRWTYGPILSKLYSIIPNTAVKRIIRGVFGQPVTWFRCSRGNIKSILKMLEGELASNGKYVEFMLHSSELMPGCSPTYTTQSDIDNLHGDLNEVFSLLSKAGVNGAGCEDYYKIFTEKK
jgi:hypothetical protein